MKPDNTRSASPTGRIKSRLQETLTSKYWLGVALTLTMCLGVYLVYLSINGGSVNPGVLLVFAVTSLVSQLIFSRPGALKKL